MEQIVKEKIERLEKALQTMRESQLGILNILKQTLPLVLRTPLTPPRVQEVMKEVRRIESIVSSG